MHTNTRSRNGKAIAGMLATGCLAVMVSGCGLEARHYVMVQERVDQGVTGNGGYLMGSAPAQSEGKKTRQVYVFELTKPAADPSTGLTDDRKADTQSAPGSVLTGEAPVQLDEPSSSPAPAAAVEPQRIVLPPITDDPVSSAAFAAPDSTGAVVAGSSVEYTVAKDDTLQKISKKFYNNYGKWTKIYNANREKIKNPNFLKPGLKIMIPDAEIR